MSFDFSTWELSRMLIALLLGLVLVAIPAAILLVRARRREIRLRRQIARLTTSQAVLGPNRSGQWRSEPAAPDAAEEARPDAGVELDPAEVEQIPVERAPAEQAPEHHGRTEPVCEPAGREATAQSGSTPIQVNNRPAQPGPPQRQPDVHPHDVTGNGNGHPHPGPVQPEPQARPERPPADRSRDERAGFGQSRCEQAPASTPLSRPRFPEPEHSPSNGDVPTQPAAAVPGEDSHAGPQPHAQEQDPAPRTGHGQVGAGPSFATEESAQRFRREYTEPMESSFRRIAELRTRLNGEPRERDKNSAGSH